MRLPSIINPGFIALYGFSGMISFGLVMPLAIFASLIFFTKAFQKHGSTVKALTMAQWIGKRYDSKTLTIFFAILSLLLITFIVLICVGLTQIISKSLNLEPFYVLLGLVIFVFWLHHVCRSQLYGLYQYRAGLDYVCCGSDPIVVWF